MAAIQVEIRTLEPDGFTGEVTESDQSEKFVPGDLLTIVFDENLNPDITASLQVGDRVVVSYSLKETGENRITAYEITLMESEE